MWESNLKIGHSYCQNSSSALSVLVAFITELELASDCVVLTKPVLMPMVALITVEFVNRRSFALPSTWKQFGVFQSLSHVLQGSGEWKAEYR